MATSAEEREASQPQTEFVRALTLTDATMLVAGSMIGSGIFIVLRRTRPDVARPYRAIGYPVLPALYILLASAVGDPASFQDDAGAGTLGSRPRFGRLPGFLSLASGGTTRARRQTMMAWTIHSPSLSLHPLRRSPDESVGSNSP